MLYEGDPARLRETRASVIEPDDVDAFWAETLAEAATVPLNVRVEKVPTVLALVDVYDVTFAGAGGTDVKAWLRVPRGITGPQPTVVTYVGYGGGRGRAENDLFWVNAGFVELHMDTRGQGSSWSVGATTDDAPAGPSIPGVMTRGIDARETYYYRRLYVDAVRAVDVALGLDVVDPSRVAVVGRSQGGGLALAVAGLRNDVAGVVAFVPFLSDIARASLITNAAPFREIADYLAVHREKTDAVHGVLAYFDVAVLAARATAPALVSVAFMDPICPPSTVFAAYNAYGALAASGSRDSGAAFPPKRIAEWLYNGHEGGGIDDDIEAAAFLRELLGV